MVAQRCSPNIHALTFNDAWKGVTVVEVQATLVLPVGVSRCLGELLKRSGAILYG